MPLRSKHLAPIIFVVFIAGIGGTMILDLWQTTSSKVPATYTSGEFAGQANPADIRGSYSFADIEKAFAVPVTDLARAFGVEQAANPAAFLCKQLEELYAGVENGEVGTDSVRWFVALYRRLPYTPGEGTLLPYPALAILGRRLNEAEMETLRGAIVGLPAPQPAPAASESMAPASEAAAPEPAAPTPFPSAETEKAAAPASEAAAPEPAAPASEAAVHTEDKTGLVRGQTTFGELRSWGLSHEAIEQALGLPAGQAGVTLRDYCLGNGIEFSMVKARLQAAVDRALGKQ